MTISRKESTWAKRVKLWLTTFGVSGLSLLAGAGVGLKVAESAFVRPYVQKIAKCQFDTLHAPSEVKLHEIGYTVGLVQNILEITVGDSVFALAKRRADSDYWKKKF